MDFELLYAGCYTRPETMQQKTKSYMLYLSIGGFNYMHFYSVSGEKMETPISVPGHNPFLALIPPEICIDFSANKNRENWAVLFNSPEMEAKEGTFQISLNQVRLNPFQALTQKKTVTLRELFFRVCNNLNSGHPAGIEKAKLLFGRILAEFIPDATEEAASDTIAAAMKAAIDEDVHFRYSIEEHNRRLNLCSIQQMRKRFEEEYGILPVKYRNKLRMNRILQLFSQTDYSLKEIASDVGMKHVEHLYAFLQARQSLSPKDLLLQIRGAEQK